MQLKATLVAGLTAVLSGGFPAFAAAQDATVRPPVGYYDDIKPVLAVHCYKCHDGEKPKGDLRLNSQTNALAGGKSGDAAIVPGSSARSELVRRISLPEGNEIMPPKGARLTEAEVSRIRQWIDEGAKWPERDDYWAFQPPKEPPLPKGRGVNPIDRFIDSRLVAEKIKPLPQADARTLLRRVFFDLLGVPPTLEEAQIFLRDKSPDAYEKLIDRLLADPRYGERWARHWLDLVRYGESDGYEDDKVRPHAWRYRDYVIRSLNADKPYDRFVQEQMAGDELWPDDPDAWIATGFARLGSWDGMSKEPAQQRQDFLNDATDAVGAAFLGVTLGCARCHDHKYDIITQRDYYRVQAFFDGVKRETRATMGAPNEPPFVTAAFKTDSAELARLKSERDELLGVALAALEQERKDQPEKKKIEDDAVKKRVEREHPGQLERLNDAIKSLEPRLRFHEPKVEAVFHGEAPKKIYLLKGGELARPGEEVAPGFIAAMLPPGESAKSDGKRSALARWLAAPENPLTARVQVNRLWQHHFGVGLVATPSDFGRNGKRPTHPELLDWLARELVRDGWSLKKMHRLMMTSAAYRRASSADAAAFAKDPENKLVWRMNRRRLEGEAIRDTILVVSGTLNSAMGGPGVYGQLPKGVNIEFPNNDKELSWGTVTEEDNRRRSIYLFQRRSLTFPLMDVFDGAPMNQSCAARPQTTVAPQALALFNGEFTREAATHFAARLRRETGADAPKQIERAFQLAFTRPPCKVEQVTALSFLQEQTTTRDADANAALADFCHVLLNASELIYPD
jgi:Protein of unknown function (DUF1553)/Protein of unknown function (DUF1549)/Planctomycete cytochrome C